MTRDILGIGLTGKTLTSLERRILTESTPYAVVLFGRNIGSEDELQDLVTEVKALSARPPLFMIDQEGGRVDRLRHLIKGMPSAEAYGEQERPAEMAEWGGRVIGKALRWFDVEVDLAPVVDVMGDHAPKGLERRIFGRNAETVSELAGAFMRGLHAEGVASCLKHWPGIGVGSADPHYGLTVIDLPYDELIDVHVEPFRRLGAEAGAIMIGHGTYPQVDPSEMPATLSRKMSTDLLRDVAQFDGIAISDDMEMHSVSDLGSYEEIAERALLAGNDCILFCSHIERIPDLQRHLARRAEESEAIRMRLEEAARRCDAYREHCERLRASAPAPASWEAVIDDAERLVAELRVSETFEGMERRKAERKWRTGREEWT